MNRLDDDDLVPLGSHAHSATGGGGGAAASPLPVGGAGSGGLAPLSASSGIPGSALPPLARNNSASPLPGVIGYSPGQPRAGNPGAAATAPRPVYAPAPYADEAASGTGRRALLISGAVAALVVAFVGYYLFRTPPPVAAPTGYAAFAASDNSFLCDAPQGWQTRIAEGLKQENGSPTVEGVTFSSGNAQIQVITNTISSQVARELVFGKDLVPESMTGSRSAALHKKSKKALARSLRGYQEKPVIMLETPMGGSGPLADPARISEFSATGNRWGLGGPLHGYRASLAGRQYVASLTCQCSERDWPKLKPAFMHTIKTLREAKAPEEDENAGMPGAGLPTGYGLGLGGR